jgi:glycosyltransferase involved in cell wall biosynthesis
LARSSEPGLVPASVSVIVPTWNRAGTIQEAIESALGQSKEVLEVLVCDDGSTDDTAAIVAAMTRRDSRVRWVAGERGGRPAIPRNRGIRESRGEWLAFLDSDDAWLPAKVEAQLEAVGRSGALAVCSNAIRVGTDGKEFGALLDWNRPNLRLNDLLEVNRIVCSSCVLHRSLLARAGGFPEEPEYKAIEDYVLWLRVAAMTDFAYCRETFVRYRDDPESSIRGVQSVPPQEQRSLVLGATRNWLMSGELGVGRKLSVLARVGIFQTRLAGAALVRRLIRGAQR